MRHSTELMNKIFSDSTPDEFKNKISEKIEEAKTEGSAELSEGDTKLKFAEVNGDVVIEDKSNDNEVTIAKDKDGEIELDAVIADKTQSATQPDVFVPKAKGTTKEVLPESSTVDDIDVTIEEGITDKDKAGLDKHYSIRLNGFKSEKEAMEFFNRTFSNGQEVENTLFSEDIEGAVEYAERVFSAIDDSEEVCFSDLEEFAEHLNNVYSDIRVMQSHGFDCSALIEQTNAYADVVEELSDEIEDLEAEEAEEKAFSDNQLFSVVEVANSIYSDFEDFVEVGDFELAQSVYSDSNDLLEYIDANFSDDVYSEDLIEALTYFSDLSEYFIESQMIFSDEDLAVLADNATELAKAADDLQENKDPELAKKVKLLADETADHAEVASTAGHDVEDVKAMCAIFSEEAEEIIEEAEASPKVIVDKKIPTKVISTEVVEEVPAGEEVVEVEEVKDKEFSGRDYSGEQRVFAKSTKRSATSSNPCLTSPIN